MSREEVIQSALAAHLQTVEAVRATLVERIASVSALLAATLASGGTIFWCGNGGSAGDSQHLAAELVGRFNKDRRPLSSVALTTNTSVLTCVANDYTYADIFARQVEALGRAGDVLVGISTSGNSENVLRAFKAAKGIGVMTVALLGKSGGPAMDLADEAVVIPAESTARIQEAHILIGHIICDLIEQELGFA